MKQQSQANSLILATVAIPTFNRPELLRKAIESVRGQVGIDHSSFEILVVDNAEGATASSVCAIFADGLPHIRYVHVEGMGPSYPRNRAVREARGKVLVFLDDDEVASPDWLSALLNAMDEVEADAVFGAVVPEFEAAPEHILEFAKNLFTRNLSVPNLGSACSHYARLGTGNSAFIVAHCFHTDEPFSTELSEFGGEDVDFLRRLVRSGRSLVWVPGAIVTEFVPASRLTRQSLWTRRFRQGQLRASMCLRKSSRDYLGLVFWMAVGLAQAVVHSGRMFLCYARRNQPGCEQSQLNMAGGLGKLFWWREPKALYGHKGIQSKG